MARYREGKRSLRQRLQAFMSTVNGQIVLNYAYNWGASVVILGALFKLIHLPGANTMLCIGMGTEVFIFFISAFDLSGIHRGGDAKSTPEQAQQPVEPIVQQPVAPVIQQREVSATPSAVTPEMEQITNDYTNRLREMTTQLERYTAQAKLMSIDSAEVHEQTRRMAAQMEELNNVYARMIEAMNNKK
jgi:hypothetical protein